MTDISEETVMAQLAWAAYAQSTNFKAFDGSPLPPWSGMKPAIQTAWIAAAKAVASYLQGPPAADD